MTAPICPSKQHALHAQLLALIEFITTLYHCHEGRIKLKRQKLFICTVNMFISAGKLSILTWGSMGIVLLYEPLKELQFLALPHWLLFSKVAV